VRVWSTTCHAHDALLVKRGLDVITALPDEVQVAW
jgi:hypothetical protein